MNKILLSIVIALGAIYPSFGCGPSYNPDYEFYNLFMQEIIDDPVYTPFLFTADLGFYQDNVSDLPNENIEQWQEYLNLTYDDAYHLVFKAKREDIENAVKGEFTDNKLTFITKKFAERYKDAILYLRRAKIMEPYMCIIPSEDSWYYTPEKTVKELNYPKAVEGMIETWHAAKDKEIKLRWGYQLTRLAHYNREYDDAINFFTKYVESLDWRPPMYYHALSQKAGAEMGIGDKNNGNYDFLQVFIYSLNLKTTAVLSMRFSGNPDWTDLLAKCKDENERNNAYMLLGYNNFNNPLNEIKKIAAITPNAIQAKVLMARTINIIERGGNQIYYWNNPGANERYPIVASESFLENAFSTAMEVLNNPGMKDKNFWHITLSYLSFLKQDFKTARDYLGKVKEENDVYALQKRNLAMYIDVCEPPNIDSATEIALFEKYGNVIKRLPDDPYSYYAGENYQEYTTHNFVIDVLANRYFLQKEYAKSFLMNNTLNIIENNPQPVLISDLERFYLKPEKNSFEEYIAGNLEIDRKDIKCLDSYFGYLWGIVYLTEGDFKKAKNSLKKMDPDQSPPKIPDTVFGVNITECFECSTEYLIQTDYISDFNFIPAMMSYEELTDVLLRLEKAGKKKNKTAAKANYLLGNFYYNNTRTGYFRDLLRFDSNNSYLSYKYDKMEEPDILNNIYFKYYGHYYRNPVLLANQYLEKAYRLAKDDELKAHIVFALSKCEQENFYDGNIPSHPFNRYSDDTYIMDRKNFHELMKYRNTQYFSEVQSRCKYFNYFVSNIL